MSSRAHGAALLSGLRATRAIVDLDAIAGNVAIVRRHLPVSTQLMAVVKADGYGHGAPWVARAALDAGVAMLGVATVSEGLILRAFGIAEPILVLGSVDPGEVEVGCRAALEFTVTDLPLLEAIQRVAGCTLQPVRIHVKIDTGLRRYGAEPEAARRIVARVGADPRLQLAGISTHFASADELDEPFTAEQIRRFEAACSMLRRDGISLPARHAANSAGILTHRGADYEIARLGIALYGVPPSGEVDFLPGMQPAMSIESSIARLVRIEPGDTVGYNRTFRAESRLLGALIPVGYADGYRRSFSGKGWVGMNGEPAPVLGRVSMDQIVVAVPEGTAAAPGDRVSVLSNDAMSGGPAVADLARLAGTNTYEILVGIRQRVPRVFVRGGEIIAVRAVGRTDMTDWGAER